LDDGLEHGTEVTYERRTKVFSPDGGAKPCLTRKVITPEDYYLAVQSSSTPAVTTKVVLRFLVESSYYELFFEIKKGELVLDFAAGETQRHPDWLEFVTSQSLTREDSREPMAVVEQATKRQRFLRTHSTEDAAWVGA